MKSNPVTIRLLNQQLAAPQFYSPVEVVNHMGAMQAQEYRMMRWAVAMRTRCPSHKTFKEAYDKGEIIRLHLMRGTWQLVAAEDYWSFLHLCAPKAIAVTKGWMASNKVSISDEEYLKVRNILEQTASRKGHAMKEDFVQALAENDIRMDDHRLSYHIRMSEMSGTLCSGELHPTKATYTIAAEKVKKPTYIDRDETLMRFTRKYFQSRQPATLEDFVWWSGLNVSDCKRGLEMLGGWIRKEMWQGRDFYLTDDCRTRGFRSGRHLLIPPYDEYLIAYKSRDIVLPAEHRHRAHNNSGIFQPIIASDGIICGNWSPYKDECQATFFDDERVNDERNKTRDQASLRYAMQGGQIQTSNERVHDAWLIYDKYRKR